MNNEPIHQHLMSQTLDLAQKGRLSVSPNPMVGCLIVKNGEVIAEGYHQQAGGPHAEIAALNKAGANAKNATVYVNLEPCCHHGRTPPCTDALINAGVKEVFIACLDPNPLVAGKSIKILANAGIKTQVGLLESQAKKLNEIFFHYITEQKPFVIAKWAMSFDGKTSVHSEDDKKISNSSSHQHAHGLREQVDAILIGASTAIQDDPLLTVRLEGQTKHKQPLRIVLAGRRQLPFHLKLFDSSLAGKTLIVTTDQADANWLKEATAKNINIFIAPQNAAGKIHLPALLQELGKREITSVLVEGGKSVHESFFQENLVNRVHVYLAPTIIAALNKKQILNNVTHIELQGDHYFTADYRGNTYV